MKRSWTSIIFVAGILGLLTLFLGLQYRWMSEANEAERERMQKRAETDVARFAEDFNREMDRKTSGSEPPPVTRKDIPNAPPGATGLHYSTPHRIRVKGGR